MCRRLHSAALVLLLSAFCFLPSAFCQFTIVTGTVTDPNGIPYAGGTITAGLVTPGGTSATLQGLSCCSSTGPVQLDSTGSFTMRLADNSVVLPGGTQWRFTVNHTGEPPPWGFGPRSFSSAITISGSSQSVSTTLSAAAPALTRLTGLTINNTVYANGYATGGTGTGLLPYTSPSGTGGIQEAYNALLAQPQGAIGGRLVIPKGFYLITSIINFTENGPVGGPGFFNHWTLVVEGDGEDSTYISCQTGAGKPCMDWTGRSHITAKNMTLYRAASGYSTVGMLFGRSTVSDSQFSEYNVVDHVTIGMSPSDMTANGGNGLIGIYDRGAEGLRVDNSHLYADWPLVLTGDDVFGISSSFVPVNNTNKFISNSVVYHSDLQLPSQTATSPALIQGQADNTTFMDTLPIGPTTGFCFDVRAQVASPGNPIRGLRFLNTQTDSTCGRFLKTTSLLQGLEISGTLQQGTGSAILLSGANAGIQNSVINLVYASASPAEPLVGDDGVANQGAKANTIYLYNGASINAPTTTGNGNVIISNINTPTVTWNNAVKTDLIQTPLGITPTLTLKKGSGAGNYTTTSTTYVDVDATNLALTVTIPTGWKLGIVASGQLTSNTAIATVSVSLFDSATLVEAQTNPTVAGTAGAEDWSLNWVITGDGASHTVKLQFKTSNAADAAVMLNSSATLSPTMTFTLTPSN